ncbi:MAG TPA: hypothetical protein VMV10_02020 [Pirellulales bacterium]|nr:hypothetical protein [Pirellulales bacterium]
MDADLNELAQRAAALRARVEALEKELGDLTLPLVELQADLEQIDSHLAELAGSGLR